MDFSNILKSGQRKKMFLTAKEFAEWVHKYNRSDINAAFTAVENGHGEICYTSDQIGLRHPGFFYFHFKTKEKETELRAHQF
ncbi:hypothetical protein [Peribacillus sp. SCS-155]|uniref:hypothetical protein n=1 Tax=Peribacillus sedimenti TaxID=3115297 RepID=UPI0039069654